MNGLELITYGERDGAAGFVAAGDLFDFAGGGEELSFIGAAAALSVGAEFEGGLPSPTLRPLRLERERKAVLPIRLARQDVFAEVQGVRGSGR